MGRGLADRDEYLRARGATCPRCRSDQLVFLDATNRRGSHLERANCAVCDLTFERIFQLEGYAVVQDVTEYDAPKSLWRARSSKRV